MISQAVRFAVTALLPTLTADYIKSAPMKMTSVALYDNTMQKWYCLILDEKNQITPVTTDTQEIRRFNTEADMLLDFLNLWEYIDPTIISGWNSGFFDVCLNCPRDCLNWVNLFKN